MRQAILAVLLVVIAAFASDAEPLRTGSQDALWLHVEVSVVTASEVALHCSDAEFHAECLGAAILVENILSPDLKGADRNFALLVMPVSINPANALPPPRS